MDERKELQYIEKDEKKLGCLGKEKRMEFV
jgi:hypothetical protein